MLVARLHLIYIVDVRLQAIKAGVITFILEAPGSIGALSNNSSFSVGIFMLVMVCTTGGSLLCRGNNLATVTWIKEGSRNQLLQ